MHSEAREAVRRAVADLGLRSTPQRILDCGGRDVNGGVRDLFHAGSRWVVIDREPGEGVTIVGDACETEPLVSYMDAAMKKWDVAIATEVFEHEPRWPLMLHNMCDALRPGGALIVTAACDPRAEHSAVDGWTLRPGELYENVDPQALHERAVSELGGVVTMWTHPRGDVYLYGRKPKAVTWEVFAPAPLARPCATSGAGAAVAVFFVGEPARQELSTGWRFARTDWLAPLAGPVRLGDECPPADVEPAHRACAWVCDE